MMSYSTVLEELRSRIGTEVHVSDWLTLTQDRIDAFADVTGDHQWIHVDPQRARRESPYGASIAHGYLVLALYPYLRGHVGEGAAVYPGVRNIINYGLNRVRFPNAVRAGARLRARTVLKGVEALDGALQTVDTVTIEIDGENKPACVAELIRRFYFDEA